MNCAIAAEDNEVNFHDVIQLAAAFLRHRFGYDCIARRHANRMVSRTWQRRRAAKYNLRTRNFNSCDWKIVSSGANFARSLNAGALAEWLEKQALIERPRKANQDQPDAAICLAIALAWRMNRDTLLIGDEAEGLHRHHSLSADP